MRKCVSTQEAPAAIGPYSQAVAAGPYLFCSGQLGLDPATGRLVPGGIESQTRRVLDSLAAVLRAAGVGLGDVVKTTVFLSDLRDFAAMNGVYAEYFRESPPARSTVQAAGLPKGAAVEIEAVAFRGHGRGQGLSDLESAP